MFFKSMSQWLVSGGNWSPTVVSIVATICAMGCGLHEGTASSPADVLWITDADAPLVDGEESLDHGTESPSCCLGVCRDPGRPAKPKRDKPGDVNRGQCPPYRYQLPDHRRAGAPHCVARWARPSITPKYSSSYVGGGATWKGRGRGADEGTWGVDYQGCLPSRHIFLRWTCGREQGGTGAYATDAEPLLPHTVGHLDQ